MRMNLANGWKYWALPTVLFLLVSGTAKPENEQTITECEAIFKLVEDDSERLRNVGVTLKVTYHVVGGRRFEDFKYVGNLVINTISVNDENNKRLYLDTDLCIDGGRDNKLKWRGFADRHGYRTVIIKFNVLAALDGDLEENSLHFDWVNKWNTPVEKMTYRFIIPPGENRQITHSQPTHGQMVDYKGNRAFEMVVDELPEEDFEISFSPGVAKVYKEKKNKKKKGLGFFEIALYVFLGSIVVSVFLKIESSHFGRLARKFRRFRD